MALSGPPLFDGLANGAVRMPQPRGDNMTVCGEVARKSYAAAARKSHFPVQTVEAKLDRGLTQALSCSDHSAGDLPPGTASVEELSQQLIVLSDQISKRHEYELAEMKILLAQRFDSSSLLRKSDVIRLASYEGMADTRSFHKFSLGTGSQVRNPSGWKFRVCVHGASDLRDADWGIGAGSSDPYCVCEVIGKVDPPRSAFRTHHINDTLNPCWSYTHLVRVHENDEKFRFTVYDKDWGKTDDFLGSMEISVSEVMHGFQGSVMLSGDGAQGELMVSIDIEEDDEMHFKTICSDSLDKWTRAAEMATNSKEVGLQMGTADVSHVKHGDLRGNRQSSLQYLVFLPFSNTRLAWNFCTLLAIIFDAFMIPLTTAFGDPPAFDTFTSRCVVASFWSLDLVFTFFTGIQKDGIIDLRLGFIALHYLKTWLIVDVVVVGCDWAFIIISLMENRSNSFVSSVARFVKASRGLRVLRLLTMVRLGKFTQIIDQLISVMYKEFTHMVAKLMESLLVIVFATHIVACMWYSLGSRQGVEKSWVLEENFEEDSFWYRYFTSFHWAITQITPASMGVQPVEEVERMFTVVVDLVGLIAFSTFVSTITATMTQLRQAHESHSSDMRTIKEFFLQNSVSIPLGSRIMSFLRTCAAKPKLHRASADNIKALSSLTPDLREALNIEVYRHILFVHPVFKAIHSTNMATICKIALAGILEKPLLPREAFFKKFSAANHMWFIIFGQMCYARDTSKCLLGKDSWVSEASLWIADWRHRGDLQSTKQSNLVGLDAGTFSSLVDQFVQPGGPLALLLTKYAVRFISDFFYVDADAPFSCTDIWGDSQHIIEILHEVDPERGSRGRGSKGVRGSALPVLSHRSYRTAVL